MKKQDLMFTCVREIEYEASSHKEKSMLYSLDGLLLDADSENMSGMDCIIAYVVPFAKENSLREAEWEIYSDIEKIDRYFHINYEEGAREYLCEILKTNKVIIIEEQRCYLRPHSREGANLLKLKEQANLLRTVSRLERSDCYHFKMLPAAYENYGRVVFNYQLFMSGLQA